MNTPQDRSTTQGTHGRSSTGSGTQGQSSADELIKKTSSEGKAQVQQYREAAADKVDQVADTIDKAASQLPDDDVLHVSQHISAMADGLGRLSDGLREKSADQILHDIGRIARQNPALFIGGSIAIGFGIARFARASAPSHQSGASSSTGSRTHGGSMADEWSSGGRTHTSTSSSSRAGSVPGMASTPATDNDTIDTISPSGSAVGTIGSTPGPAASIAGASLADASFPGSGSESGLGGNTTGLTGTVTGTTAGHSTGTAGTSTDYLSGSKPS